MIDARRGSGWALDHPGGATTWEPAWCWLDARLAAIAPALRALARGQLHRDGARAAVAPAATRCPVPGPIQRAADALGLDQLAAEVLVLAIAPELDVRFARLYGFLCDDAAQHHVTAAILEHALGLAMGQGAALVAADAPLARAHLVGPAGSGPRSTRSLVICDEAFALLAADPVPWRHPTLPPARAALAPSPEGGAAVVPELARWLVEGPPAVVAIVGAPDTGRSHLAVAIADRAGLPAIALDLAAAGEPALRRFALEARWRKSCAVVSGGERSALTMRDVISALPVPLIVVGAPEAVTWLEDAGARRTTVVRVGRPSAAGRRDVWRAAIGDRPCTEAAVTLAGTVGFGPRRVEATVRLADDHAARRGVAAAADPDLLAASRWMTSSDFGSLAARVEFPPEHAALIVPAPIARELDLVCAWARHGPRLWSDLAGAAGGIACMFHGPPGTGKTLAAGMIARRLDVDLYRVDLSRVVDKYLGETEKHLGRVLDVAADGHVALLFDEADALFGKRTAVKDAHDRYANIETGYLLQRLESHRGLVILTTNFARNLDDAFLRRLGVVVEFPLPSPDDRARIWERHLVGLTCAADVDPRFLARCFACSGGDIRNATQVAQILAAEEVAAISMRHLAIALFREVRKAGRLVDAAQFGPWRDDVLAVVRS